MTTSTDEFFNEDPWGEIDSPCYPEGRRLYLNDARFWVSIDDDHRLLFFVQDEGADKIKPLENLSGLEVSTESYSGSQLRLVCRLTEPTSETAEKFAIVAKDVAFHCSRYSGVQLFIKTQERIRSWADFLKPSRGGLSDSEFVGLFGELFVLAEHILPHLRASDAIRAWIGPDDKKQDFTFNKAAIEVKTTFSGDKQTIPISSLDQLDRITESLYMLRVIASPSADENGFCLEELYERCLRMVAHDFSAESNFLQKVSIKYSQASDSQLTSHYVIADMVTYEVLDDFPKLTSSSVQPGIRDARYEIGVSDIATFEVPTDIRGLLADE